MYLATKKINGRQHYLLRESYPEAGRNLSRDLFDLGEDPSAFILYPGGNRFYFHEELIQALAEKGVTEAEGKLEKILLSFLKPHIQRIIIQMTRLGRKRRLGLSKEAMARAQAGLHIFDRRRLFLLRFGRMDRPAVLMRPHRFLNVLLQKSRDEAEFYFEGLETRLKFRERKMYVYHTLDLSRHFPGELARLFPLGLDEEKLDQAFLKEICLLNQDPGFLEPPGDAAMLSPYLVRYAVMWFDYEFGQRPPQAQIFEEFVHRHRAYRPPPPAQGLDLDRACRVFSITRDEWRSMNRDEVSSLYRRLALACHPDQGGDPEEFMELNTAYQRLIEGK